MAGRRPDLTAIGGLDGRIGRFDSLPDDVTPRWAATTASSVPPFARLAPAPWPRTRITAADAAGRSAGFLNLGATPNKDDQDDEQGTDPGDGIDSLIVEHRRHAQGHENLEQLNLADPRDAPER